MELKIKAMEKVIKILASLFAIISIYCLIADKTDGVLFTISVYSILLLGVIFSLVFIIIPIIAFFFVHKEQFYHPHDDFEE